MTKLNFKQSLQAGLFAAGTAATINAILFFAFHSAGIISDTIFPQPNEPMTIAPVIMASIIPSLIGSMVFFLIEKFSNKGFRIFSVVSIVLVLISLYSPFTVIPGVTTGYALVLCMMHLVVAGTLIYFIGRSVKKLQTIKN